MAVIIDGTNGITTPLDVEIQGSTSGSIILAAPAVAGSNTQTLVAATGTLAPLISGTSVSAAGTSVAFTDVPSWVKRIQFILSGVSSSGTSNFQLQLGTGATPTYTTSGYSSTCVNTANTSTGTVTSGLVIYNSISAAADAITSVITLVKFTGDTWVSSGTGVVVGGGGRINSGSITLGAALTAIRLTTINGTDTFDAGSVNILYE